MARTTLSYPTSRTLPVRRASSSRAAMAHIAQIAHTDMPGTLAAPMLFEALHDCVRYTQAGMIWANETGVVDGYFHGSNELRALVPTYANEFFGRREAEVVVPLTEAVRTEFGPTPLSRKLRVSAAAFYRHDYYGCLMQPFHIYHGVRWVLRCNGKPLGMLMLGRPRGDGDLRDEEIAQMRRVEIDLARALSLTDKRTTPAADYPTQQGSLICNARARVLGASGDASCILSHWIDPRYELARGAALPPAFAKLVVKCLHSAGSALPAANVITQATRWGRFSARAEIMAVGTPQHPLCLIHLRNHQPLVLALLNGAQAFDLPPQQTAVCLRLATGMSEPEAATDLGLSVHTVTYYRRLIYARLGIEQRQQLQAALLTAAGSSSRLT
ncbi:MAG: LuxR C-terminal-related transcriptional regulator [Xanthomonadales bacterium]|nr:LuxR C-terminal-related transcriptional regulator [Xanthomonadales bacterium]